MDCAWTLSNQKPESACTDVLPAVASSATMKILTLTRVQRQKPFQPNFRGQLAHRLANVTVDLCYCYSCEAFDTEL